MAATPATPTHDDSLLLELRELAGWQLRVHNGATVGIRATRADVELAIDTPSFAEAAGTIFAQAMRSSRHQDQGA
jgi:hypothetical protein